MNEEAMNDSPLTPKQFGEMFTRTITEGGTPEDVPSSWAWMWFPLDCSSRVPDGCASASYESFLRAFLDSVSVADEAIEAAWQWYVSHPMQENATKSYEDLENEARAFIGGVSCEQTPEAFAGELARALADDINPDEMESEWLKAIFGQGGFKRCQTINSGLVSVILRLCGMDERGIAHLWEWYRHLHYDWIPRPRPAQPRRFQVTRGT